MSFVENLYKNLPVTAQNLSISLYGWYWQKRRFGGVFEEELIRFKNREKFTQSEWINYQNKELRKILINAFINVPFYTEKYTKAGFKLEDFEKFEINDLPKLPYLDKDELRLWGRSKLLSNKLDRNGAFYSSSGSTGTPTSIFYSKRMHQKWTAGYEARVKNWAGVNKHMTRGMIGGRRILPTSDFKPPYYRYNFFEKMVYFSAYHISKDTVPNYIEGMKNHCIDFLMGYAMSNYFIARIINEQDLNAPKLKAVITSSEKLTDEMREELKKAYKCDTFDTWSGVEACAQISECEFHTLHESPDIGIIEVLNTVGKSVNDYEIGEAVCTSLINYDQPLIRYRCGDLLKTSSKICKCGREMRTYDEIIGRIEDTIIGPDGREMVRFHGIFIDLQNVSKGQIIQHSLTNFEVKVETINPLTSEEKKNITKRMENQLGKINLVITEVNQILYGNNGKFKAVISNIKRRQ